MTIKLTLSIKQEIVELAKRISRKRGKSISKMFEEYLTSLLEKDIAEATAVDKIKRIIVGKIINPEADWEKVKEERISNKYGV